jgi:hypothetical protein
MPKVTINFIEMIQDSQDYGSDDEHMVSRVFFNLSVGDRTFPNLHTNIKQTVGSSFDSGPIEVSKPVGYTGPMNYELFRDAVESLYRSLVGSSGTGIRIGVGSSNIRMRNNGFSTTREVSFDVAENSGGAW